MLGFGTLCDAPLCSLVEAGIPPTPIPPTARQVGGWARGHRRRYRIEDEIDPREIRKELEALLETAQDRLEDKPVPKAKKAAADYRELAGTLSKALGGEVEEMFAALDSARTLLTAVEKEQVEEVREAQREQHRRKRNRQLAALLALM